MNDRELLELAAQAAGIILVWDGDSPKEVTEHWSCDPTEPPHEREWDWNPVSDDGDALRLAVRLGFINPGRWPDPSWLVAEGMDWNAATRRAIVRAAAEIGRQMQEGGAA